MKRIGNTPYIRRSSSGSVSAWENGIRPWWLCVFFLSGAAGLGYEVLWFKALSTVFGSSAEAAAIVFATFFLGFAAGSYSIGKLIGRQCDAARSYGLLELCTAVASAGFFFLFLVLSRPAGSFFIIAGGSALTLFLLRILFGAAFLTLSAFFLGGTFPAMVRVMANVRQERAAGSLVYSVQTSGAAFGVLGTGFYVLSTFGFRISVLFFTAVHILCGLAALIARRRFLVSTEKHLSTNNEAPERNSPRAMEQMPVRRSAFLALSSGYLFLASEVLWFRMFALATPGDVYSFTIVLTAVLAAIGAGGALAYYLSSRTRNGADTLCLLLWISGVMLAASPLTFSLGRALLVDGYGAASWFANIGALALVACATLFPAAVVMGSIFPLLLNDAEPVRRNVSHDTGELLFFNTVGAIAGSLFAGFLMVRYVGIFWGIALLGMAYAVLAMTFFPRRILAWRTAGALLAILVIAFFAGRMSEVSLSVTDREVLERIYRGSDGVVSVVSSQPPHYPPHVRDRFIKLNDYYILGGRGAAAHEARQAHLALFLHPAPKSIFFLGMGTGITAGAALLHPVERVVVTEINPEVVRAAREYFEEENNGLFHDPRARVVAEDGRQYLFRTRESYDVIVGDLFDAQASGVGNLYTKEHFALVRARLNAGGIFAQWLPLHQLSLEEFGSIARTFLDVFPQVTLWRGNFDPEQPIVALIGEGSERPLDPVALLRAQETFGRSTDGVRHLTDFLVSVRGLSALAVSKDVQSPQFRDVLLPHLAERTPFTFYAGNISEDISLFQKYPILTDDRPFIEYLAAKNRRETQGRDRSLRREVWDFTARIRDETPPGEDTYLSKLSPGQRRAVYAGDQYARFTHYDFDAQDTGSSEKELLARETFQQYMRLMGLDRLAR